MTDESPKTSAPPRRAASPSASGTGERKRRRKTLACYDCRRRKLRCDRNYPACARCVKAGNAGKCIYDSVPGTVRESSSPSVDASCEDADPVNEALHIYAPKSLATVTSKRATAEVAAKVVSKVGKVELLEERIARLEALSNPLHTGFRSPSQLLPMSPATKPQHFAMMGHAEVAQRHPQEVEMIFFKGSGFATQFFGASNPTSMISQFPELRAFMKDAIKQYTSLARVQTDLRALNARVKTESSAYLNTQDAVLLSMIPEKHVAHSLVQLYFETLERLYRVLHVPSFWADYQSFWEAPQKAKPSFVVKLLVIMASVKSLAPDPTRRFIGRSSQSREIAIQWVRACELWLDRQSRKNVNVENFQIRCLIDIAKHMNTIKKKRAWETAGHVLRVGMGAGLHRDPSLLGSRLTFFEQEMRRRIWATMVEWELQASISRGMSPSSAGFSFDCAAPLNIDDHSFNQSTVTPPISKPPQHLSDSSFLHLASKSLRLRIALTSLVNDPTAHVEYDEVLKYEEKIIQSLDAIPPWQDDETLSDETKASCLLGVILLEIQLRQFLIWLHFPFASRAGSDSRYNYSRTACFNSASIIIDQHSKLMGRGNFTLCLLRNDGFLSAICICHNVFASSLIPNNVMYQSLVNSFSPVVERGLRMQEEKVMRLGEGRNHYWFISASFSFVQAKTLPETAKAAKQQAVDRVTRLFYRILAAQEDYSVAATATTTTTEPSVVNSSESAFATPSQTTTTTVATSVSENEQQLASMQQFDPFEYIDASEWALDNLWPMDTIEWY